MELTVCSSTPGKGIHGIGEGSLGHMSTTVETTIHEMKSFIIGLEAFQTELLVRRLSLHIYADGGQIKIPLYRHSRLPVGMQSAKHLSNRSTTWWAAAVTSGFEPIQTIGTGASVIRKTS